MAFKIGDKVRIVKCINDNGQEVENHKSIGGTTIIQEVVPFARFPYFTQMGTYFKEEELALISSDELNKQKKTIMQKLSNTMKKVFDKDTQTLIKAGYYNSDLSLTLTGREALDAISLLKNKTDLVAMAQEELDEEAKQK